MLTIEIDDRQVLEALQALQRKTGDLGPVLKEIGEDLVESTKQRFADSRGPDGSVWPANSPVTIARMLGLSKSNYTKKGKLSPRGINAVVGKKPLIGETGHLSRYIKYQIRGNALLVGSTEEYAAMQQFGGTKAEFPHLWGDIPARPFLGLSAEDRAGIVETVRRYLEP